MTNATSEAQGGAAVEVAEEAAGATKPGLFDSLWAGCEFDLFVSRDLATRDIPVRSGLCDFVWIGEPPAEPVCFYRLTPARMLGLISRQKARRAKLDVADATRSTLSPAEVAVLDDRRRRLEADTETVRLIRDEFKARWPKLAKRMEDYVAEDLEEPARPSDAWSAESLPETRPLTAAPPLTEAERDLIEWAAGCAAPEGAFKPTPYAVVLDGRDWLTRLLDRARGDAHAGRSAALRRLRSLRAKRPEAAGARDEAAARLLAAQTRT